VSRRAWIAAVVALLAGLLVVEGIHGSRRISAISERAAEEAIAGLRGDVARHAARLEDDLALAKAHARYLASLPSVAALVGASAGPGGLDEAGRAVAGVLAHFPAFGSVVVLDRDGDERLRVERMGGGVAVVPAMLLREHADRERAAAALALPPGAVSVSPLEIDANRVDVAARDRQVLRYAAPIRTDGVVVLSIYAAPIFDALRRAQPAPGVSLALVDTSGAYLAHPDRARETGGASLAREMPRAWDAIVRGERAASEEGAWLVAAPTGPRDAAERSLWLLVAHAPAEALARGSAALRSEAVGVGLLLLATVGAVVGVGIVLYRMAVAQARLEAERAAERRLAEAERLAAVGRLTAGVAHEINNPLAGIGNYLALLERQGGDPERRREYLDLVRHGFERIRAIVRDLLNVASPPAPRREPVELPAVLEKVERVTRHDRGFRDIAWSHRYAPGLPAVSADPFALEQVFLNLALNARDAMPNGGAIAVDARPDPSDPRRVSIVFEDTGPGFPPDVLPRIFEPFFTTRAAGTGLGLSVTASIVRAHGGTIRAENREAGGARFLLALASCT